MRPPWCGAVNRVSGLPCTLRTHDPQRRRHFNDPENTSFGTAHLTGRNAPMAQLVHHVDVSHTRDADGEITDSTLTFTCTAGPTDPCRNYPGCDCESWNDRHNAEHPAVPQPKCWLEAWFEVGDDATPYDGGDGQNYELHDVPDRSGPIAFEYDDGIIWRWLTDPPPSSTIQTMNGDVVRVDIEDGGDR